MCGASLACHSLLLPCCCNILSLFVFSLCSFDQYVFWCVSPWVYPVCDSLHLLDLIDYFLFHVGEIFNYNLFKIFLIPFLFLFFFWDPYNSNVGTFNFVPEVSETSLSSFHSFYWILLFSSYFHHFIFQLTDLFFASDILLRIPSRVCLISVIVCLSLYAYSLILLGLC